MNAEVLTIKGEKFAVLPFDMWEKILEELEDAQDIADAKEISAKIASGEMECFPSSVVDALIDGENAVKVYREYRGLTQTELAEKAGVTIHQIRKIEAGESEGSVKTLKAIANALKLDLDDIV